MFEELSDSVSTPSKLADRDLIYIFLILTVESYDFDTCTMIFINILI